MTPEVEAAFKGLAAELRRGSERRRHTFLMGMHRRYESSGVLQPCVYVVHHMTYPFPSCLLWHVPTGSGASSAALAQVRTSITKGNLLLSAQGPAHRLRQQLAADDSNT